jgi:hypothetical protein
MGFGAGLGASRPAAVALIALGAAVILWALLLDLPVTQKTGAIGQAFDSAVAKAGRGFYTEIIGSLLLVSAGALALVRKPQRSADRPLAARRDRPTAAE